MTAPAVDTDRLLQIALAYEISRIVADLWEQIVDITDLFGTSGEFVDRAVTAILDYYRRSSLASVQMIRDARQADAPQAGPFDLRLPEPDERAIRTGLLYVSVRQTIGQLNRVPEPAKLDPPDPVREALDERAIGERVAEINAAARQRATFSAVRNVLNGGRDTVDEAIKNDPACVGFMRVTVGDCCYWCAMLASRGPVYSEDSFDASDARFTGPGDHKCHDSCRCTLIPAYSRDRDLWTDKARQDDALWAETGAKFSGDDAVYAFRRAYEGRTEGRRLRK